MYTPRGQAYPVPRSIFRIWPYLEMLRLHYLYFDMYYVDHFLRMELHRQIWTAPATCGAPKVSAPPSTRKRKWSGKRTKEDEAKRNRIAYERQQAMDLAKPRDLFLRLCLFYLMGSFCILG